MLIATMHSRITTPPPALTAVQDERCSWRMEAARVSSPTPVHTALHATNASDTSCRVTSRPQEVWKQATNLSHT